MCWQSHGRSVKRWSPLRRAPAPLVVSGQAQRLDRHFLSSEYPYLRFLDCRSEARKMTDSLFSMLRRMSVCANLTQQYGFCLHTCLFRAIVQAAQIAAPGFQDTELCSAALPFHLRFLAFSGYSFNHGVLEAKDHFRHENVWQFLY